MFIFKGSCKWKKELKTTCTDIRLPCKNEWRGSKEPKAYCEKHNHIRFVFELKRGIWCVCKNDSNSYPTTSDQYDTVYVYVCSPVGNTIFNC